MHVLLLRLLQGAALALGFLVLRLSWFAYKCWQARQKFLACAVPGPPLSSKLTGHIPDIMGPKGPFAMAAWANTYGPLYKMQFLDEFVLVLTDPETISRITRRTGPGPYTPKPRNIYASLENGTKPAVPNILTSDDGDYWKAVRQAAAPCFSMTNLRKVLPQAVDLTKRVAERMCRCGGLFDVTDGAKRITSDIMGDMLLGEDLGGTRWEHSEYLSIFYGTLIAQAATLNNPFHMWQLWRADIRHQRYCMDAHDRLMDDKVKKLREQPPPDYTIAAHLLKVIDPSTGKPLHKDRLKAEIAVFMAAGFETTSHAITWSLAALATFQDVQEELFQELVAAGLATADEGLPAAAAAARDIDSSDLGRLPFLSAVIKEVLRLCPPAPFGGSRQVVNQEGAQLCGYKVHKGTVVMIPCLAISLAKHNYGPDTMEFKPHRWMTVASGDNSPAGLSDASDSQHTPTDAASEPAPAPAAPAGAPGSASPDPMTFLTGPRDCIGQNLAKLELHVVLATLLSRFKFSPGPELHKEIQLAAATGQPPISALHALAGVHITLQPLSGSMMLQVEPRHGVMA